MTVKEKRYRPSVTLLDLQTIIDSLDPVTNAVLIKKLKLFEFKVSQGHTQESYTPVEADNRLLTPEQKREAAYMQWQKDPESCSPQTIGLAELHRYNHDLMTDVEKEAYEKSQFDI